ncbi:MAG TPA: hypothetical protein VN841_28635 [Bryobacteraceae bacterium]|nr:hypothetical protein [Bryobacteraceae bacterium]
MRQVWISGATALAALSLLCCVAAPAAGQAGQNATLPLPPKMPPPGGGMPDLNGVWELPYTPDLERPFGGPLPFTAFGAEKYKTHLGGDDPHGYCQPTGPTRAFHSPFPFQLVQSAGMLVVLFEIDHNFRRIFTDGRPHPKDLDTTWYGDSIGRYEGNKLFVDTTGISDRSWLDTAGHQHSDKLHVTEVFEKSGQDNFTWTVTYDDPVYFAKPWSITLAAKRQKYDIMEMICTDNNQDMPHYITSRPKP